MRELYACCDLYATASRSEVHSVSMLEAMAMGLPVLQLLDKENSGQITEGVNGYTFRTAEEFHALLKRFCGKKEALSGLRASTAASVHKTSQEAWAGKVEKVYLGALKKYCNNCS